MLLVVRLVVEPDGECPFVRGEGVAGAVELSPWKPGDLSGGCNDCGLVIDTDEATPVIWEDEAVRRFAKENGL